jgi:hypothetical protein
LPYYQSNLLTHLNLKKIPVIIVILVVTHCTVQQRLLYMVYMVYYMVYIIPWKMFGLTKSSLSYHFKQNMVTPVRHIDAYLLLMCRNDFVIKSHCLIFNLQWDICYRTRLYKYDEPLITIYIAIVA